MKTHLLSILILTAGCCLASAQTERYVTITAQGLTVPPYAVTNEVSIVEGETAEVVTLLNASPSFTKNGLRFGATLGNVVKGPATFQTVSQGAFTASTMLTLKVMPESFPPDKTLILPPGTNQVFITLESSTNLVNWASATNGVYGSPDEARFFRIHLQKL